MKKLVFIFSILSLTSCIAQKTFKMEQEIIMPEITKKSETFNINLFNRELDSISGKRIIVNKKEYLEEESQSYGYIRRIYLNNSYFMVSKKYFENGNIKQKGISFNNGYPIGFIYKFNKKGKLINEINTDEGYDFGWLDIIKYCHKNDIQLEKGYPKRGGIKTEIYKNEEEGKKVWIISYYKPKTDEYIEITLDGKTGKEIKRRDLEFIGN